MITRNSTFRVIALSLLAAFVVWGCCETDPTILNIGPGAGSAKCPDGTTNAYLGCGLGPNPVPTNHLDIYVDSNSIGTSLDISSLIIGIPLATGAAAPSAGSLPQIDYIRVYNPANEGSPSTYGTAFNISAQSCNPSGFDYLSSPETNAYHECWSSYSGSSGGNSWSAWSVAAQNIGLNPVRFALYWYDIAGAENAVNHGLYDIFLTGNLPVGTMEIAYGCATGECSNYCYVTPFDNAGQVVPEPSSLFLVAGAALAMLGARLRKKKS
jgi:hypothetical protein